MKIENGFLYDSSGVLIAHQITNPVYQGSALQQWCLGSMRNGKMTWCAIESQRQPRRCVRVVFRTQAQQKRCLMIHGQHSIGRWRSQASERNRSPRIRSKLTTTNVGFNWFFGEIEKHVILPMFHVSWWTSSTQLKQQWQSFELRLSICQ